MGQGALGEQAGEDGGFEAIEADDEDLARATNGMRSPEVVSGGVGLCGLATWGGGRTLCRLGDQADLRPVAARRIRLAM